MELKGTKKKKGKKIDDPDFMVSWRSFLSNRISEYLVVSANHATNSWKRCAKGCPSNSSDYKPQSIIETDDTYQGIPYNIAPKNAILPFQR